MAGRERSATGLAEGTPVTSRVNLNLNDRCLVVFLQVVLCAVHFKLFSWFSTNPSFHDNIRSGFNLSLGQRNLKVNQTRCLSELVISSLSVPPLYHPLPQILQSVIFCSSLISTGILAVEENGCTAFFLGSSPRIMHRSFPLS